MENQQKINILHEEIKIQIDKTVKRSKENKLKGFGIYIAISILSALITFLVAIKESIPSTPENIDLINFSIKSFILLAGASITILSAWEGFYNHKQLWLNYGETASQLKNLEFKIRLLSDEEINNNDTVISLRLELEAILDNARSKWKDLRIEEASMKD
ncbi:DUF4231 domain-containing protein [Flammeovirga kamogawensis]|uniref:DUF4231 domain-containing protein n=1 Tax=Flammeovirga kamogawensis TaxID=373891 RepID=A0ABX8GUK3_9BACT|nr:DUF4231 domain-containing protein [Flammeovirga kamogawensis]MBB6459693.1 hypothetical protein [Flammeovirga kamogawensis]QWG07246.1 DUF4231 domain-containing protein [Flammeovirga kamogawensis]TRX69065.1 DUF4231 domain-containing protein [Flammeovirga kamogawensis]